jgi:hypothetical protein
MYCEMPEQSTLKSMPPHPKNARTHPGIRQGSKEEVKRLTIKANQKDQKIPPKLCYQPESNAGRANEQKNHPPVRV